MAAARSSKPARRGVPNRQARMSPPFPGNSSRNVLSTVQQPTGPPTSPQANGAPAYHRLLSGLTGTTVTLSTKAGVRYEGVVGSTSGQGETPGVTLKDVKELNNLGAPLKDQLFIASSNIDNWSSGPTDSKLTNGDTFRTDTDISQKKAAGRERELQAWIPNSNVPVVNGTGGDDETFGPGLHNTPWDQFAANEQLFGVKASFDEDAYTTKINRSASDFKEREQMAQRLANEILSTTSNNPHIAEERVTDLHGDDVNEEERYGAVIRGTNAYVPPGARKTGSADNAAGTSAKRDVPKVSINGPDGTVVTPSAQTSATSKAASPNPTAAPVKQPADPLPAFRDFVSREKHRLTQRRQALVRSEMAQQIADLVKFSRKFKFDKPIPDDLLPILAKDEAKQRVIREKAQTDAAASAPVPTSGSVTALSPASRQSVSPSLKNLEAMRKSPARQPASANAPELSWKGDSTATAGAGKKDGSKPAAISMFIQTIPPYKGYKARPSSNGQNTPQNSVSNGAAASDGTPSQKNANVSSSRPTPFATPLSPATTAANNRLNVNASSFRPNSKANAFVPGNAPSVAAAPQTSASTSPSVKVESAQTTLNPFFGARPFKKGSPAHIKDDFNPFKSGKVPEPASVSAMWPYTGKRYMNMFPPLQPPPLQHQPHFVPGSSIPPPSYEEDSAAMQTAQQQRAYVYQYAPYGYPGQPMMAGMPPHGPPGAYIPGAFMQPMPYPPGMPPHNAMYPPPMGQISHYGYSPQPTAGPRPHVPHAYYHQSPPIPHATVPYPVMMLPNTNAPPHPYEGGPSPPVQM